MHAKPTVSQLAISSVLALAACSGGDADDELSATGKFKSLSELLANPFVQDAIADLPAGDGVAKGHFYEGNTPADISGTWSTECCGGARGSWANNGFAGTFDFRVVGPGKLDLASFDSQIDEGDGAGSFITGTDNHVTAFLQLALHCKQNDEHVRAVAIDRFTFSQTKLTNYVRSYVVLAREFDLKQAKCAVDPIGAGMTSTPATLGRSK